MSVAGHGLGDYRVPGSLPELLSLLERGTGSILAGGTDLVLMRADGLVDPGMDIIDVKSIQELRKTAVLADGRLAVGAATTLRAVALSTELGPHAITDGAALVGGWQTRARGTIGGNICRASPAGDTLAGVLVSDAELELSSTAGTRVVPATNFFVGPGRTVREPNEVLTRVLLPPLAGGSAYVRFTYRLAMDLAVVGVAARVAMQDGICVDASLALTAAAATPVLARSAAASLIGTELSESSVATAADLVMEDATPIDDGRGSRAHRSAVLPVLARRAISTAKQRTLGGTP